MMKSYTILLILASLLITVASCNTSTPVIEDEAAYIESIETYGAGRFMYASPDSTFRKLLSGKDRSRGEIAWGALAMEQYTTFTKEAIEADLDNFNSSPE